jgi:hypothetical protein
VDSPLQRELSLTRSAGPSKTGRETDLTILGQGRWRDVFLIN